MKKKKNYMPLKLSKIMKYMFDRKTDAVTLRTNYRRKDLQDPESTTMVEDVSRNRHDERQTLYLRIMWCINMLADTDYLLEQYNKEKELKGKEAEVPIDVPEKNCRPVPQPMIKGLEDYSKFPVP